MSSNTGSTLLALVTGAAIGAGIGILFAPDKGEETRKKISKEARKAQKDLEKRYQKTSSELSAKAHEAKISFDEKLADTLSTMSFKADDILVALEQKLEDLRVKNAKLQKKAVEEKAEAKLAEATN
ncbi:YtxH domain-containing protein [Zhouia sp. PK063]|uniref:YtxH domain-containing protein n=1 Tax=Zhouia sp. PK063 TaxID=3373602 RepID=UPI0037965DC6